MFSCLLIDAILFSFYITLVMKISAVEISQYLCLVSAMAS